VAVPTTRPKQAIHSVLEKLERKRAIIHLVAAFIPEAAGGVIAKPSPGCVPNTSSFFWCE
jgi:hypothetical protein